MQKCIYSVLVLSNIAVFTAVIQIQRHKLMMEKVMN